MPKLTPKQYAIIEDIFAGDIETSDIIKKHRVSPATFNKYLTDELFKAEFIKRIEWLTLQSQAIIARYGSLAAAKLVELPNSEHEETRRKACLDIISLPKSSDIKSLSPESDEPHRPAPINSETAAKILDILAKTEKS